MSESFKKTALITGSTGFIGSSLTRRLLADGWMVHIIVRPGSHLQVLGGILDDIAVHQHDGTTERMFEILCKSQPTIVFHLASLFLAQHKPDDIESLIRSNILFPTQLADAMAAYGVRYLINAGTSWQHFNNEDYSPVCLYASTKQAYEAILQYYIEAAQFAVITLMLFDTYGPDDRRRKLFTMLREAAEGKKELLMSPGEQLIDLVYIDDVVEAFIIAAHRLLNSETVNHEHFSLSCGAPSTLKEIVKIYCKVTNNGLHIDWGGRPYRYREVMVPWNNGKILPGWHPKIDLEEGIRRLKHIHL
jgi:nucleoside-diphosphate-sugar epimerase